VLTRTARLRSTLRCYFAEVMKVALVEHLLIAHNEGGERGLLNGNAVARALTVFDYHARHTAETDYINQVALERIGIEVTEAASPSGCGRAWLVENRVTVEDWFATVSEPPSLPPKSQPEVVERRIRMDRRKPRP
jgi:hypothetical protein